MNTNQCMEYYLIIGFIASIMYSAVFRNDSILDIVVGSIVLGFVWPLSVIGIIYLGTAAISRKLLG